jgi:ATP-binding cassette subfamily B protein
VRLAVTSRFYYGSLALVGALGTAAVYWVGGRAVIEGAVSIGTLTALAAYVARLYSPLTDLAGARVDLPVFGQVVFGSPEPPVGVLVPMD